MGQEVSIAHTELPNQEFVVSTLLHELENTESIVLTREYLDDEDTVECTVTALNNYFGKDSMTYKATTPRPDDNEKFNLEDFGWELSPSDEFSIKRLKNEELDAFLNCFDGLYIHTYSKSEFVNVTLTEIANNLGG